MQSRLRWRVLVTLLVTIGVSMFAWYPPLAAQLGVEWPRYLTAAGLKLGLDLAGGVHVVLRVHADEAVLAETGAAAERVVEALRHAGIERAASVIEGPAQFRILNVPESSMADVRRAASEAAPDYTPGHSAEGALTFTMPESLHAERRRSTVEQSRQVVERRIDQLGVSEPVISVQGDAELALQLPGVTDVQRAIEILGTTALLELKLVAAGPAPSRDGLRGAGAAPDLEVAVERAGGREQFYLLQRPPVVTGRDLRMARATLDEYNRPAVAFSLTGGATERFAGVTRSHVGRQLAIVLDGEVVSAPVIEGPIVGEGHIRGGFTTQEAADLALVLRAGALPASLSYEGGFFVGPSLGEASVWAGVAASIGGLVLIAVFMLAYYRRTGVNAVLSIAANLLVLLGLMAWVPAALSLPGFAGLILTIGMGVDSNVLIYERIKEELARGRTARAAVAAGFDRVFLTILDTHIASLVAAAFLFQFGTGPVRGFATTLTFGLLSNVFTAVFVSRTLFEVSLRRRSRPFAIGVLARWPDRVAHALPRWQRPALAISTAILLAGAAAIAARGVPLGIDFSGGTLVQARFDVPVTEDAVRAAIPGEEIVQRLGERPSQAMLIRRSQPPAAGATRAAAVDEISRALDAAGLPAHEVMGSETVGPAAGAELRRKGLYATAASLAGIAAYLAVRFNPAFAAGAVVATCHDLAVTVSLLTLAGYELSLNVVAALLATAGYSVNDTIVIFDRVREHRRASPRLPIERVVSLAVGQTLARTCLTAGTTALAVLALFLFGGEVLEAFSFAMLAGIVTGTWSTLFIATTVAVRLGRRSRQ